MNLDKWVRAENRDASSEPIRGDGIYPTKLWMAFSTASSPLPERGFLWAEINSSPVSRHARDTPGATAKLGMAHRTDRMLRNFPCTVPPAVRAMSSERGEYLFVMPSNLIQISLHYRFNRNLGVQWRRKPALEEGATEEAQYGIPNFTLLWVLIQ